MAAIDLAAALWVAVHIGLAGTPLRARVAARLGEGGFRGLFAALSIVSLALLILAYRGAGTVALWALPAALHWLLAVLMLPAFVLLLAALAAPNPTAAGQHLGADGPRGITRITRHPMLWSFAIWALLHLAANGDLASVLFFGALALTALAGMPSIDRKLAARDPAAWARLAASTSIVPFGAIAAGRNRLALAELRWIVPVGGTALWLAMLFLHRWVIGVPALP